MINLQGWRDCILEEMKQHYMDSRIWKEYKSEWIWELAIVDEALIEQVFQKMDYVQKDILLELLDSGILLYPIVTSEAAYLLSHKLNRPISQCKRVLKEFIEAGICLMLFDGWHDPQLLMPYPIFHTWRQHLIIHQIEWACAAPPNVKQTQAQYYYASVTPLHIKLLLFLKYLGRVSMKLTKAGQLTKPTIQALKSYIAALGDYQALEKTWIARIKGTEHIVYFYLELAFNLGILEVKQQHMVINAEKLKQWLALTEQAQRKYIEYWLMQLLLQAKENIRVTLYINDAINNLQQWNYFEYGAQDHFFIEHLAVFAEAGYISYLITNESHVYVKKEYLDHSSEQIYIQNNGEIILMPGVLPRLLWNCLSIAEVTSLQEIIMLKLSFHQTQCYVNSYSSLKALLDELEKYAEDDLPSFIQQWHHAAKEAVAWKDTTMFLLMNNCEAAIFFEFSSITSWARYCSHPLGMFQQVPLMSVSQTAEYFANDVREQLPHIWYTGLRAYHRSTLIDILQIAIKHGLSIILEKDGVTSHLIPDKMESGSDADLNNLQITAREYTEPDAAIQLVPINNITSIQLCLE